MKHTPWFDGTVAPVRRGLYQVERMYAGKIEREFLEWLGTDWAYPGTEGSFPACVFHTDKWRGLTTKDGK